VQLSIRLSDSFTAAELLEINANALLSKYFGESAGQVLKVFTHLREKVDQEPEVLFVMVVDEIESLAASRSQALARGAAEPSDSVRVVNAVLQGERGTLRTYMHAQIRATCIYASTHTEVALFVSAPGERGRE
jgi:AAA+ superfamily predicted ATPase